MKITRFDADYSEDLGKTITIPGSGGDGVEGGKVESFPITVTSGVGAYLILDSFDTVLYDDGGYIDLVNGCAVAPTDGTYEVAFRIAILFPPGSTTTSPVTVQIDFDTTSVDKARESLCIPADQIGVDTGPGPWYARAWDLSTTTVERVSAGTQWFARVSHNFAGTPASADVQLVSLTITKFNSTSP